MSLSVLQSLVSVLSASMLSQVIIIVNRRLLANISVLVRVRARAHSEFEVGPKQLYARKYDIY